MKKVHLQAIKKIANEIKLNDGTTIMFSSDYERIDKMIGWLFDNAKYRFVLLGTETIYFENNEDALHFMMVWG